MKKIVKGAAFIIVFMSNLCQAQSVDSTSGYLPIERRNEVPVTIGKPMPDFVLTNVTNYPKKIAELKDFKGKWLFLDFWFGQCVACIRKFLEMNEILKKHRDMLNIVYIGTNDKLRNGGIELLYEQFRKKYDLQMISAYDSTMAFRFGVYAMPHIIMIDPQGIVRGRTNGFDMTSEKVGKLIKGEEVDFFPADVIRKEFEASFYSKQLKDTTIIYSSRLVEYNKENFDFSNIDNILRKEAYKAKGIKVAGMSLSQLYNIAVWGTPVIDYKDSLDTDIFSYPILEVRDQTPFVTDWRSRGLYNYSLVLGQQNGAITKDALLNLMKEELCKFFGYTVKVEYRDVPAWRLVDKPGAKEKLKTSGGNTYSSASNHGRAWPNGFILRNYPIKALGHYIKRYLVGKEDLGKIPFLVDLNISENIDIKIEADMFNYEEIRKELNKYNLDLVRDKITMKAIVITDRK